MTTVPVDAGFLGRRGGARLVVTAGRAAIAMLALLLGVTWWYHARLVSASEAVDAASAQVANVVKRRTDLIPALVAVTAAYAHQEKALLDSLSAARLAGSGSSTHVAPTEHMLVAEALTQRVLAVGERYPALRASPAYARLRLELLGTENRVATERARYVDAVRAYRTLRRAWPSSIVARAFDFPDLPSR